MDYDKAGDQPVLINIDDTLFMQFNRAKKMNIDTEERRNQLAIVRNDASRSTSVAGLDAGQEYRVSNWQGSGQDLVIAVCNMSFDDNAPDQTDKTVVSIGLGQSYCNVNLRKRQQRNQQQRKMMMMMMMATRRNVRRNMA